MTATRRLLALLAVVLTAGLVAPLLATTASASPAETYGRQAFREAAEKRAARDLPALVRDRCLQEAATRHARQMARESRISEPWLRPVRRACDLRGIAVNVAGGFDDGDRAVRGWMGVPADRDDLLRPRTTLVVSAASRNDKGTWYVVQLYGARRPAEDGVGTVAVDAGDRQPVGAATTPRRYAGTAYRLTNRERTSRDLPALDRRRCVQRFAAKQARAMAREGRMYHQELGPILGRCDLSAVGENVAYGYADGRAVVAGWMGSEGHRANILNRGYRVIGVGAAQDDDGRWYAAQVFGG